MKTFVKILLLIPFLFSCNSGDDEIIDDTPLYENELRISLDERIKYIYSTDTVFAILEGNGGYTAKVSDENYAKVEIVDTLVYVSFLKNGFVKINITDITGREKEVLMDAYHTSLVPTGYTMSLELNSTHFMDLGFGAGDYRIDNIKGSSAEVSMENDKVKATGNKYGNTYFDIIDKRGSKAEGKIIVGAVYDLTTSHISINMIPDQMSSISLKWGKGWTLTGYDKELFKVYLMSAGEKQEYDVLQIDSFADKTGTGLVQIRDKDNNTATIFVNVK